MGFDALNGQKEIGIKGSMAFHFGGETKSWKKPKGLRPFKDKYLKYQYARDFIENMEIPEPGGCQYAIVSGSFIFGDIILPLAKAIGGQVEMDICTLSIGQENIDMVDQMFEDGHLSQVRLIFSDYFYAHENHAGGLWRYLFEILDKWPGRYQVSVGSVHTKIVMMKSQTHNLVLSGSANLRSSANVEQFDLRNDLSLHSFNSEWMDEIHSKFAVSKKPLRSRKNLAGIFERG